MKIKAITSDDQWFHYLKRAARANGRNEDKAIIASVSDILQTMYNHSWINALHSRGRKYKGNRLYKMCIKYFDSLTGKEQKNLIDKYFLVDWNGFPTALQYMEKDGDQDE